MKLKTTEEQPAVKKRFSIKPLFFFFIVVIIGCLGLFCYRQYNLSKDPYLQDKIVNGFYNSPIENIDEYSSIHIEGIDKDKRSYNIDIDPVMKIWNGNVSYVESEDSSAVVTESLEGTFTEDELMKLVDYINSIDETTIIRVDSNGDKVALVREAALADDVKDSFEDFMGFFYQSELSLDEYMAQ